MEAQTENLKHCLLHGDFKGQEKSDLVSRYSGDGHIVSSTAVIPLPTVLVLHIHFENFLAGIVGRT